MHSANTQSAIALPATGFVRLKQIIGDRKAEPPIPPVIPVCASEWWKGVRDGRFPQGVKLGAATTVWRAEDIHELIETLASRRSDSCRGRRLTRARLQREAQAA